jgi:hypothetical protein
MTSTDLLQQRANECRRLAAAARKGSDRAFWLGLVERWEALESQSARQQHQLRQDPPPGNLQSVDPAREGRATGASPAREGRCSQPRGRRR